MAKEKKIEIDDMSEEAIDALADKVMDKIALVLSPAPKDEEEEESEAAEEEEDADEDAEESDDEGEEEEDDEEDEKPKKKGKKKASNKDEDEEEEEEEDEEEEESEDEESEDDEEEEGEDEESEDDEEDSEDDDDEEGDDDDAMTAIQEELEVIPEALFKQAKTESAAVNTKEAKAEMVEYFTRRDVPSKDAKAMVDGLKEKDLKGCYADYYARFLDTDGEVHDKDDPYKALRIVKGKEVAVWCCNGVPMKDGKCVVNPKVKAPADKKATGKKPVKKGKK